jgi:hypothetical protein
MSDPMHQAILYPWPFSQAQDLAQYQLLIDSGCHGQLGQTMHKVGHEQFSI